MKIDRIKVIYAIVAVLVVGVLFLLAKGLFSAWALLELAWSTALGFVSLF